MQMETVTVLPISLYSITIQKAVTATATLCDMATVLQCCMLLTPIYGRVIFFQQMKETILVARSEDCRVPPIQLVSFHRLGGTMQQLGNYNKTKTEKNQMGRKKSSLLYRAAFCLNLFFIVPTHVLHYT
jgi:hypothetical protein